MRRRAFVRRMVFAALASGLLEWPTPQAPEVQGWFDVPEGVGIGRVIMPAPPEGMAIEVVCTDAYADREVTRVVELSHYARTWEVPALGGTRGTWRWVEA